MLTAVPLFLTILPIMSVSSVRGLSSYKTRFNPPFSTSRMPVPCQEYYICYPFV